jgi:SAM-dependent methyltransferase
VSLDIWNDYWRTTSVTDAFNRVAQEERSLRFRRLEDELAQRLGPLAGLRTVELGAGPGVTSLALARRGAGVTLVDRVPSALEIASELARKMGVKVELVGADLFKPPPEHVGSFDVALSFGVAEHFEGDERKRVVLAHLEWLRPGGVAVVSVPNRLCPTYRLWKWWLQRKDLWPYGYEEPFTPQELRHIGHALGGVDITLIASSAIGDLLRFATPMVVHKASRGRVALPAVEAPSPFDTLFGYAITLVLSKPDSL